MRDKTSELQSGVLNNLRYDFPAGLVVFLVALPLCLGIALASNAPLFSGVVTGVVAGILVGWLSGSQLSVSGPAAGLTVVVAGAIHQIGAFEGFLVAVVLSGVIQIGMGLARTGALASLFPVSVIKGMLVAIGLTIILKQIPHALGGRGDFHDEMGVWDLAGHDNVIGEIARSVLTFSTGAVFICVFSLVILLWWETPRVRRNQWASMVPAPLVAVVLASLLNQLLHLGFPGLGVTREDGHLVALPHITGFISLLTELTFPEWAYLSDKAVWSAALVIAAVGSIETLLCIESTDKLDPFRRTSDNNRELMAQGTGNIVAGLLGGIPMTSVIVRSSANIYAGARTRMSAIFHGLILAVCVILIPHVLNYIPLASLAAVLFVVGFKLAHPSLFRKMFRLGMDQFVPFIVTILAILVTNLLTGVLVGLVVGLLVVLKTSYYSAVVVVREKKDILISFTKDVTFVHKLKLKKILLSIPNDTNLLIDGGRAMFVDHDIYELVEDFAATAKERGISVDIRNMTNKKFAFLAKKGV